MMLCLISCNDDKKLIVSADDFSFKATNLSIDNGKLTATSGTEVTVNWTVNVTINGQTTLISGISKSNELPVNSGDEIKILFTPSCTEDAEAFFTLPDGSTRKLTVDNPSFNYIVPKDFKNGMKIFGRTNYETADAIYNRSGEITLVSINR